MKRGKRGDCVRDNVVTGAGGVSVLFAHPETDIFSFRWSERTHIRGWTQDAMGSNISIRVASEFLCYP
jgi:hypothetical protein